MRRVLLCLLLGGCSVPQALCLRPDAVRSVDLRATSDANDDRPVAVDLVFAGDEKAAAWLTSPCNGNVRATQVFWRSVTGTAPPTFGSAIEIFRAGTFPNPGALQQAVLHREAQRLDQMQMAARVGAEADDVAGVRRNLRLEQDDMEH